MFTIESKRGLDTRVSLKQALANQGFDGGTRGDTEWSQWVKSEKEQLSQVMERQGIEWEQLGTHDEHLSVMDYKKVQRSKEVATLEKTLAAVLRGEAAPTPAPHAVMPEEDFAAEPDFADVKRFLFSFIKFRTFSKSAVI